jgi:hypothetical protein
MHTSSIKLLNTERQNRKSQIVIRKFFISLNHVKILTYA